MSYQDWVFSIHLLFAATLVGGFVMSWIVLIALRSVDAAGETLSSTALQSSAQGRNGPLELAAIVETIAEPVLGKTLDVTIRSWNAGAEQLYGYSADEVVGKKIDILVPPECVAEIDEILERLRRGETIKQLETVRRRRDGTSVDVSLSITPVRSSFGNILGASAIHYDISERKRREEVQRFLAEASRLLAASVDHRETLPKVASLTLRIADSCVIEAFDAAGSLTEIAIANREPAKMELQREMRRRCQRGRHGERSRCVARVGSRRVDVQHRRRTASLR
ncbi:MAG TPA: PAS domain S-box protein [Gaiellaceae bacterium]